MLPVFAQKSVQTSFMLVICADWSFHWLRCGLACLRDSFQFRGESSQSSHSSQSPKHPTSLSSTQTLTVATKLGVVNILCWWHFEGNEPICLQKNILETTAPTSKTQMSQLGWGDTRNKPQFAWDPPETPLVMTKARKPPEDHNLKVALSEKEITARL